MAARVDFTIYQGANFKRAMTWAGKSKQPRNLTGASITLEILPSSQPANKIAVGTDVEKGGIVITNPTQGAFEINIPPAVTNTFIFPKAKYNLNITFPNGDVTRLLEGEIKVNRRV